MAFECSREHDRAHFQQGLHLLLLAVAVLGLSGCWDEIHYTPSKSSVAQSSEPVSVEATQVEELEVEGPTSDELFGGESEFDIPSEEQTGLMKEELLVESVPASEAQLDEPQLADSRPNESLGDPFGEGDGESSDDTEKPRDTGPASPAELEWTAVLRPSRTALAAWKMSSRWSFAAAVYAKGLEEEYYGDTLQQANYAAELLEMALPAFPTAEKDDLQSAVIDTLLHAGRSQLAELLAVNFSPEYASLAELAIKSNVLLLVYTPKSRHLDPIVAAIRRAAESSTLPPSLWEHLVELLEQRAPYSEIKAAVLKLHQQVGDYLGGSAQ